MSNTTAALQDDGRRAVLLARHGQARGAQTDGLDRELEQVALPGAGALRERRQGGLHAAGIACEVVPGVTAASAAAAQFGFPLTHRGEARRLLIATARVKDGALVEEGWSAAADPETTLALYMGREQATAIVERLVKEGRSPATPVIAIENAGRDNARAMPCDLAGLPKTLADADPRGPVVLLIGNVAARADVSRQLHHSVAPRAQA
mgnify:CR=1 FL=1